MKKIVFVLTVLLLATPVMANVTISCAQRGLPGQGYAVVDISYLATEDGNLPRGFGLEVTVDNGVTITGVDSADPNYWVNPGSIVIVNGSVTNPGTPVVGTLPASSIILEMGSLHHPTGPSGPNSPNLAAVLITLQLSGTDCNVAVSGNATRGKVVNYAAKEADTAYGSSAYIAPPCWTGDATSQTEWDSVDRPVCWCASVQPRQCHGDADGLPFGKGNYWVSTDDLNIFIAAFSKDYATIQGQTYLGTPLICADYDHEPFGKGNYRASTDDLNIFIKWFSQTNLPDPNCADVIGNQE